jgi:hypothetical protein
MVGSLRLFMLTAILFALIPASSFARETPRFTTGNLSDLKCDVASLDEAAGFRRIAIDVKNGGTVAAEPLVFEVVVTPKVKKDGAPVKHSLARASFPFAGRFGRPVPPNGKQRYELQLSIPKAAVSVTATVRSANWFGAKEGVVAEPKVAIEKLGTTQVTGTTGDRVEAASARLSNPLSCPVDLVLLATYKAPLDSRSLVGVRLAANESRDVVFGDPSVVLDFEEAVAYQGSKIVKLDLVDWCCVAPLDPAAAASVLEPAYARWVRWNEPFAALRGRFRFSEDAMDASLAGAGAFRIDAAGSVEVTLDAPGAANASTIRTDAANAIAASFADLRRRPFAEVVARNTLRLVGDGVVEIDGPGYGEKDREGYSIANSDGSTYAPNLSVEGNVIVGSGDRHRFGNDEWGTQPVGDGYVVTRRVAVGSNWSEYFSYGLCGDLVVPLSHQVRFDMVGGGIMKQTIVELSAIEFDADGAAVPQFVAPTGDGVAALRAAWDAGYRYPADRKTFTAKFDVTLPGTDHIWGRHKKVAGSVSLEEFRGFLQDGSGWRQVVVEQKGLPTKGEERVFAYAFSDRLVLWIGRDFNGRGDFDAEFAGATIAAPDANGVFAVTGSRYAELRVKDGRVAGLRRRDGADRTFTWTKVGAEWVVTRIVTGEEELLAKFMAVGGRLLPTEFEFRRVFGKDWGPEKIALKEAKLE